MTRMMTRNRMGAVSERKRRSPAGGERTGDTPAGGAPMGGAPMGGERMGGARGERGIAAVMALWMIVILTVLVTSYVAWVQQELMMSNALKDDVRAQYLAQAGVFRALGMLVADRAQGSTIDMGLILSEVNTDPVLPPAAVKIHGGYASGLSDRVSLFNPNDIPVDISGWQMSAPSQTTFTIPNGTTLQPHTAEWFTCNLLVNSGTRLVTLRSMPDNVVQDTASITTTGAGNRVVCLPDGGNNGSDTYYWIRIPSGGSFEYIDNSAAPGASDTNGYGIWLDGYRLNVRTTSGETTYTFPAGFAFLREGGSLLVSSRSSDWTYGTSGDSLIDGEASTIPWINPAGGDTYEIRLLDPAGAQSSTTGDFAPSPGIRWKRTSDAAAMDSAYAYPNPGTIDGSFTNYTTPSISEVYDTETPGSGSPADHLVISKIWSGGNWGSGGYNSNLDAVEIYNPTGSAVNVNGWKIYTGNPPSTLRYTFPNINIDPGRYYMVGDNDASCTYTFDAEISTFSFSYSTKGMELRNASGTVIDAYTAGWKTMSSSKPCVERVAVTGATAAEMAPGGVHETDGNGVDNDVAADWVLQGQAAENWGHTNLSTTTEFPPSGGAAPIHGNEFIEITLGRRTLGSSDDEYLERRYEYIEVYNTDSVAIDVTQYWIQTGTATPSDGNQRWICPLFGSTDTVPAASYAVIIPVDADTSFLGISSYDYLYGLGPSQGGAASDTLLNMTASPDTALDAAGEYVVLGTGSGGSYDQKWGQHYPATGPEGATWYKLDASQVDATANPWTFCDTNWDTSSVDNGTPGDGPFTSTGRFGVDGPGDAWATYLHNGGLIWDTAAEGYYNVRIYDEGGRTNANYASQDLIRETLMAMGWTSTNADGWYNAMADTRPYHLSTESLAYYEAPPGNSTTYILHRGNTSREHEFGAFTVYGDDGLININTADSYLLVAALSGTSHGNPYTQVTEIRDYLDGADNTWGTSDDTMFHNFTEVYANTSLDASWSMGDTCAFASNNYFTIVSSGTLYENNDPVNGDTIAQRKVMAVVRRSTQTDRSVILYWREVILDAVTFQEPEGPY